MKQLIKEKKIYEEISSNQINCLKNDVKKQCFLTEKFQEENEELCYKF